MDIIFSLRFSKSRPDLINLGILTDRERLTRKNGTWTQELDRESSPIPKYDERIFCADMGRSKENDRFNSIDAMHRIAGDSARPRVRATNDPETQSG